MRSQQLNLLQKPFSSAATVAACNNQINAMSRVMNMALLATSCSATARHCLGPTTYVTARFQLSTSTVRMERQRGLTSCPRCGLSGRPLQATPTENINPNLHYCKECSIYYSTSPPIAPPFGNKLNMKRSRFISPPYPKEISAYLDEHVIGQPYAKRVLSNNIYQHYRRLQHNQPYYIAKHLHQQTHSNQALSFHHHYQQEELFPDPARLMASAQARHKDNIYGFYSLELDEEPQIRLEKSNIILIGPSGVGKTFITEVLAKKLDVPIAMCDCTSMTQAGYVGDDVESALQKLLQSAHGDVERAQQGIVFLDEIDKLAASHATYSHAYRDVSGEGVQQALLKMVEGTVVDVKTKRKGQQVQEYVPMDTTNILFIASGAFNGLERVVSRRLDKQMVGFGAPVMDNTITDDDKEQQEINQKRDKLFSQADQGDMIKFGMIPELVGRFPVLVPFHSIDKQMLLRVLIEPKNSLLAQKKLYFSLDNVTLEFDDEALEEIARLAHERKVGARALRSVIDRILQDPYYEAIGSEIETIRITKDYVRGEGQYKSTLKQVTMSHVAGSSV